MNTATMIKDISIIHIHVDNLTNNIVNNCPHIIHKVCISFERVIFIHKLKHNYHTKKKGNAQWLLDTYPHVPTIVDKNSPHTCILWSSCR